MITDQLIVRMAHHHILDDAALDAAALDLRSASSGPQGRPAHLLALLPR